jgi:hypothetical protein
MKIVSTVIETAVQERKERIIKPFTTIAIIVFSLMGFIHLLRLFFGWEIIINGMILPLWISAPGFAIASGLAFMLWRESRK